MASDVSLVYEKQFMHKIWAFTLRKNHWFVKIYLSYIHSYAFFAQNKNKNDDLACNYFDVLPLGIVAEMLALKKVWH